MALTDHPATDLRAIDRPAARSRLVLPTIITCAIGAGWLAASGGLTTLTFPIDDAAITLANARALLSGHDPVHVGVSPFTGATSTIHLLLTNAALALLGDPHAAAFAVAMGGAWLYVFALLRLTDGLGGRQIPALVAGLAGCMIVFQFTNGLETVLAAAVVAWVLGSLAKPDQSRFDPGLALVLGVAPFVRPELAILAAGMLAARASDLRAGYWRPTLVLAAAAAGVAGVMALVTILLGGSIVPSTLAAKRYFFPPSDLLSGLVMLVVAAGLGFGAMIYALSRQGARELPVARAGLTVTVLLLLAYAASSPLSLTMNYGRYVAPLAPVAALAVALASRQPLRRVLTLSLILIGPAYFLADVWHERNTDRDVWMPSAAFVRDGIPRQDVVVAHDIGRISLHSGRPVTDIVGLKSPWVTDILRAENSERTAEGLLRGLRSVMRTARPDWIIALDFGLWKPILQAAEQEGAQLAPVRMFGCDTGRFCMTAWRITWPGGR